MFALAAARRQHVCLTDTYFKEAWRPVAPMCVREDRAAETSLVLHTAGSPSLILHNAVRHGTAVAWPGLL